jgi:hypothetical protein
MEWEADGKVTFVVQTCAAWASSLLWVAMCRLADQLVPGKTATDKAHQSALSDAMELYSCPPCTSSCYGVYMYGQLCLAYDCIFCCDQTSH